MLTEVHHKLFNAEAWIVTVVLEGMEAYKLFKDYLNQKIDYSTRSYLVGKDEVRSKVATRFSDLDLIFFDDELEVEDKPTPKPEPTIDPPTPTA